MSSVSIKKDKYKERKRDESYFGFQVQNHDCFVGALKILRGYSYLKKRWHYSQSSSTVDMEHPSHSLRTKDDPYPSSLRFS